MNVAIVGCGRIGATHAACIREEHDVDRLLLCDSDPAATQRLAQRFGAAATYADPERMLAREALHAVHLCTPPETHAALASRALAAGARVLVEKPMALDGAGARTIAAALRRDPEALCVDHNFLFEPEMLAARAWVQDGAIGDVRAAEMFYGIQRLAGLGAARDWTASLPGGRLTDVLPHPIYLLVWALGAPQEIAAFATPGTRAPEELGVLLGCERGPASIRISLTGVPYELRLTLRGTEGSVLVDFARQRSILARQTGTWHPLSQARLALATARQSGLGTAARVIGKLTGRSRGYPGMRRLIAAFYDSLRRGLPPPVSFAEGLLVAQALESIHRSLAHQAERAASGDGHADSPCDAEASRFCA